jgi:hypothetical protein
MTLYIFKKMTLINYSKQQGCIYSPNLAKQQINKVMKMQG